jgi:hypothetical protein
MRFASCFKNRLEVKDAAYRFNIVNYILPHYPGGPEAAKELIENLLQVKVFPRE